MQTETTKQKDTPKGKNKKASEMSPNEKISKALNLVNEARDEKISSSKASINSALADGKETFDNYRNKAKERWDESVHSAETRVKASPFKFVLGASILGVILGFLLSGRRK